MLPDPMLKTLSSLDERILAERGGSTRMRTGVVDSTSPMTITLNDSGVPYVGVASLVHPDSLSPGDRVAVQKQGYQLVVTGKVGGEAPAPVVDSLADLGSNFNSVKVAHGSGTAPASGSRNTTQSISHGLGATPQIVGALPDGNGAYTCWLSSKGSSSFTVGFSHIDAGTNAGSVPFVWWAWLFT